MVIHHPKISTILTILITFIIILTELWVCGRRAIPVGSVTAQPHSHSVESTQKTNVNNNKITINTATRPHTPHETTSTMRENKSRHLTVIVPSTYNVLMVLKEESVC